MPEQLDPRMSDELRRYADYYEEPAKTNIRQALDSLAKLDLGYWWHCFPRFPSLEEGQKLEQQARLASGAERADAERRLRIWRFFFTPDGQQIQRLFEEPPRALGVPPPTPYETRVDVANRVGNVFRKRQEDQERRLAQERDRQLGDIRERKQDRLAALGRGTGWSVVALVAGIIMSTVGLALGTKKDEWLLFVGGALALVGLVALIALGVARSSKELDEEESRTIAEFLERLRRLQQEMTTARDGELRRLEELFGATRRAYQAKYAEIWEWGEELYGWWKDDLIRLRREAIERMSFEPELVPIQDLSGQEALPAGILQRRAIPNPLLFVAPADLQQDCPPIFHRGDREKHLWARRPIRLVSGGKEILHGVYYIQFLLIGKDMVGMYACFFDFISGLRAGERTSEQYYADVVSIGIRSDFREMDLPAGFFEAVAEQGTQQLQEFIENAPTFTMSLTSGEKFEITMENVSSKRYYWNYVSRLGDMDWLKSAADTAEEEATGLGHLPTAEEDLVLLHGARDVLETMLRALRAQLRKHKQTISDQFEAAGLGSPQVGLHDLGQEFEEEGEGQDL